MNSREFLAKVFILFLIALSPLSSLGSTSHDEGAEKAFDPGKMIMHHIQDDYKWHFATIGSTDITLYLPVILYSGSKGLSIFSSSRFNNESGSYNGYFLYHGKIKAEDGSGVFDISITKNVVSIWMSVIILLLIFFPVAKKYKERKNQTPKGLQSFFEPIVVFVRDEIAIPMLGKKHKKYLPYLLTIFFFIWVNNLLGLLPTAANASGNIAFTMTLALCTFLVTNFTLNKHYWRHIFAPPGVPVGLIPILAIIEFVSLFTKPFALMIRLFANITAGHIIVLSIIGLIFIFSEISAGAGIGVSVFSMAFAIFIYTLELLVGVLQAYIFTILSALFIGDANVEPHAEH